MACCCAVLLNRTEFIPVTKHQLDGLSSFFFPSDGPSSPVPAAKAASIPAAEPSFEAILAPVLEPVFELVAPVPELEIEVSGFITS